MASDGTNAEGKELTADAAKDQEVAAAGTAEPEAKQPEPQVQTVEELQKQLADERAARTADAAKLSELGANYKALQRNLEAARREGQSNTEIRKLIEELQENQAATLDLIDSGRVGNEELNLEQTARQAPKKSRLETLREQKASTANVQQRQENARTQMLQMLAVSGLDPATAAKATDTARIAFEAGDYEKAVNLFGHGLSQVKKAPAAPQFSEKDIEERANLKALQMMKERGLLDVDLGGSSSSLSGSDDEFLRKYGSPDYTPSAADHKRAAELNQKIIKGG